MNFSWLCPYSCYLNIILFCESAVDRPYYQRPWSGLDEINDERNYEIETDLHHLSFFCLPNFSNVDSFYLV